MLIHGHTHQPRFQINIRDAAHPIGILAAGSFSLQLPLEWQAKVANQFHLITVDGRESVTNCIQGRIESWSYHFARGGKPSVGERDGIAHAEPFGVYLNPPQFREALELEINSALSARDWVKWTQISDSDSSFKYARPEAVFRALHELSEEIGIIVHGDSLDTLVLLKRETSDA